MAFVVHVLVLCFNKNFQKHFAGAGRYRIFREQITALPVEKVPVIQGNLAAVHDSGTI